MGDRTKVAAGMILSGEEGVLEWLRSQCSTPAALSTAISRIRTEVLARLPAPRCEALLPFGGEVGVAEFVTLPLGEMVRVQRQHRYDPTWSDGAEAVLASLSLLPDSLLSLKLTQVELISLKRKHEGSLLKKQEELIRVPCAYEWLQYAIYLVRSSTEQTSFARVAIPLLLLSGRRTTELMNGKSEFAPTARPTTCTFAGQIKKRGGMVPYEIPLLCDVQTFSYGMHVLRAKQRGERLEPAATNNRYQKMLNLQTTEVFPFATNVHQLRAIYAAFAFQMYTSRTTFNLAAMRMLGHEKLEVSLSYNAVELEDLSCNPGCLGPLPF